MKEIIKILKNYKILGWFFWLVFIMSLIVESTFLIFPQILRKMMEIIEQKWDFNWVIELWYYGFWLLVFTVVTWYIISIFEAKLWWLIYAKKFQFYKKELFKKTFEQISNEWTWKLVSRFTRWVEAEANIFLAVIQILTNSVFRIWVIIIIFAFTLPEFLFLVIWFVILIFLLNLFTIKKVKYYSDKENEVYENNSKIMVKIIWDFLTVKFFWKEKEELFKSKENLNNLYKYWPLIKKYQSVIYSALFFAIKWLEILIFLYIWYSVIKWDLSIALLTMLVSYLWVMRNPIDVAINEFNRINKDIQAYKKLQEFIQKPNEIKNGTEKYIYKTWKIEFKWVDFGYLEKDKIFEKLNLSFLEWKKNALVGHSWGWKSTIIKILLRLYDYNYMIIIIEKF